MRGRVSTNCTITSLEIRLNFETPTTLDRWSVTSSFKFAQHKYTAPGVVSLDFSGCVGNGAESNANVTIMNGGGGGVGQYYILVETPRTYI